MAVVADFEANPVGSQTGLVPPSDDVQFTDLSTGSPDRWLWDFGDGFYSDEQHPLHTFEGVATDTFTVKLTAWIFASEGQSGGGSVARTTKITDPEPGNAAAFAAFVGLSYSGNSQAGASYLNQNFGSGDPRNYDYLGAKRVTSNANLASLTATEVFYFIEAKRELTTDLGGSWTIDVQGGELQILVDGSPVVNIPAGVDADYKPVYNISAKAGAGSFSWTQQPNELILPDTADATVQGLHALFRLMKYTADAEENIDSEEKVDYVIFGVGPTASFTGVPTAGSNPVATQFNNTSIEAIGLPTTYSWKKRKTGSGDAFVEFSTQKHPSHIFTK